MKRKFESGDCVKLAVPYQGEYPYGYVDAYDRKSKKWRVFVKGTAVSICASAEELTYMPPFFITDAFLKKLLRYEIVYADFEKHVIPEENWEYEESYEFSLEDMIALMKNLREKKPTNEELCAWADLVFCEFDDLFWNNEEPEFNTQNKTLGFSYPQNDAAMADSIYHAFYRLAIGGTSITESIADIPRIVADIENYRQKKPIKQYLWTIGNKLFSLKNAEDAMLKLLTAEEKQDLREIILELAEKGYAAALRTLGYACYGGNDLFSCDWDCSRDCFLKLITMDEVDDFDKCGYANTLGYIFYYGRCNNGIPEYDKAYKYFSLGAAGGMYESIYKLSDMYVHGYGVPKNSRAAMTLVDMVYTENLRLIKQGRFDCQFADVALRMGNLCRDGICHGDPYYYYTLADFAIRKRMAYDYYGDSHVFSGIQKELSNIRQMRPLENMSAITTGYPPDVFAEMFDGHACFVTVKPLKNGMKITVKRMSMPGRGAVEGVFECYPDCGYCNLIDKASVTVFGAELKAPKEKQSFIADGFDVDWSKERPICTFTHHEEEQFSFVAEKFVRKLPVKSRKEQTEYLFASVVFTEGGHTYDYICELSDVKCGDRVIVMANGEEKEVEVVRMFKMVIGDMPLTVQKYKKILKKV